MSGRLRALIALMASVRVGASLRGPTTETIETTCLAERTDALRLSISDSNDHGYRRVVELEEYAS